MSIYCYFVPKIAHKCAYKIASGKKMCYTENMKGFYEAIRNDIHSIEIIERAGCSAHFHAQVEVLCVTDDDFYVTINGETQLLHAGDVCVSGSYDVHTYTAAGKSDKALVLIFPLEYLQRFLQRTRGKAIMRHVLHDKAIFDAILSVTATYREYAFYASELFGEGFTDVVLGLLQNELKFAPVETNGQVETVRLALGYIRDHYEDEITLESLSKQFGYSSYHFSRLFNAYIGVGLKQYVNSVRLEAAIEQLKDGKSVTDAALDSGFNSMRSFYREFFAKFGQTPQQYVRLVRAENKT